MKCLFNYRLAALVARFRARKLPCNFAVPTRFTPRIVRSAPRCRL